MGGRPTALWTMVVFFAATLVFVGARRLTEGEGAAVTVAAQLGTLAVVVGVVALVARRLR